MPAASPKPGEQDVGSRQGEQEVLPLPVILPRKGKHPEEKEQHEQTRLLLGLADHSAPHQVSRNDHGGQHHHQHQNPVYQDRRQTRDSGQRHRNCIEPDDERRVHLDQVDVQRGAVEHPGGRVEQPAGIRHGAAPELGDHGEQHQCRSTSEEDAIPAEDAQQATSLTPGIRHSHLLVRVGRR
jgi:hypothetical protein